MFSIFLCDPVQLIFSDIYSIFASSIISVYLTLFLFHFFFCSCFFLHYSVLFYFLLSNNYNKRFFRIVCLHFFRFTFHDNTFVYTFFHVRCVIFMLQRRSSEKEDTFSIQEDKRRDETCPNTVTTETDFLNNQSHLHDKAISTFSH